MHKPFEVWLCVLKVQAGHNLSALRLCVVAVVLAVVKV